MPIVPGINSYNHTHVTKSYHLMTSTMTQGLNFLFNVTILMWISMWLSFTTIWPLSQPKCSTLCSMWPDLCDPILGVHGHPHDYVNMISLFHMVAHEGCHVSLIFDHFANHKLPFGHATLQSMEIPCHPCLCHLIQMKYAMSSMLPCHSWMCGGTHHFHII